MRLKLTFDVELTEEQIAELKGQLPPSPAEQPHLIVGTPDPEPPSAEPVPAAPESSESVQEPGAVKPGAVSSPENPPSVPEVKNEGHVSEGQ